METEMDKHKIESDDLKRCGEITTLLSIGKKEFFLNCSFCDYTFLQLENFVQHMCEDHMYQFTASKIEDDTEFSLELQEEIDDVDIQMQTACSVEESDDDNSNFRDFERVEIELDESKIDDSTGVKDEFIDSYISEDSEDVDIENKDNAEHSENSSELATYIKELGLGKMFDEKMLIAVFKSYEEHTLLWDTDSQLSKHSRKRDTEFKDIAIEIGMPSEWQAIRKMIGKLSTRLRTEFVRKKIYHSKGKAYTPLFYNDLTTFLKPKRQSVQIKRRPEPTNIAKLPATPQTESLLNDEQSVLLAEVYKEYTCLWDENDIAYRFSNRRREALKAVHEDFNSRAGLNLTEYDIGCEISRLRKLCSHEKKLKIICKRQNKAHKPSCKFYEHISYLEVDVRPFECSICGVTVAGICQYKVHLASHDGSLPFKCHVCGHGFKLATNLSVHLRRHVHDYLYKCELCGKPCATTTEIKIHMRSHTGEKPFVCDICGKNFQTASKINLHMRRHENRPSHWCEVCNKSFFGKGLYNEHMNVHSNVRDKICNECGKGFTSAKHLRQHKQIHAPEKKYCCRICDKRFAQYAGLSGHMKSHGTTLIASSTKNFDFT
ncbi:zinc finger protein 736 isoform X2 [Ceratitis capitata]|uniref:Zinc finger protein 426 n=1 Tax=Ceratitis capitata TaxID=7213 RepID=W8C259_CERCA|nr:zinc finger protein 736 isoform X2 [Ceratitis capitata]